MKNTSTTLCLFYQIIGYLLKNSRVFSFQILNLIDERKGGLFKVDSWSPMMTYFFCKTFNSLKFVLDSFCILCKYYQTEVIIIIVKFKIFSKLNYFLNFKYLNIFQGEITLFLIFLSVVRLSTIKRARWSL